MIVSAVEVQQQLVLLVTQEGKQEEEEKQLNNKKVTQNINSAHIITHAQKHTQGHTHRSQNLKVQPRLMDSVHCPQTV